VAWVTLNHLDQLGVSALTLQNKAGQYDGLVLGHAHAFKWMADSEHFRRSTLDQKDWPAENAKPDQVVQIAAAYAGRKVTIVRNGTVYASYSMKGEPAVFGPDTVALIGPVNLAWYYHYLNGSVLDARVYDRALSVKEIAALKPGLAADPAPLAWWDFSTGKAADRTACFRKCV
jgi:hypothetical protein